MNQTSKKTSPFENQLYSLYDKIKYKKGHFLRFKFQNKINIFCQKKKQQQQQQQQTNKPFDFFLSIDQPISLPGCWHIC